MGWKSRNQVEHCACQRYKTKKNGSPLSDGKCIGKPILCHGFDEFTRIKKPEFRIDHQERPEGFRKRDFGSKTKPSERLFCLHPN
jgi:hypothetical protein